MAAAVAQTIGQAIQSIDVGHIALGFIQGILGIIGTALAFLVLPFFTFYLVNDQPKMARTLYASLPMPWRRHVSTAITVFMTDFATYFKAELMVGSIIGVTVAIGTFVIGLIVGGPLSSFALLFGLIAFVMELLPQIGPILSYIPALLVSLTISPAAVVLVGIFYLIIFTIEGSILVPAFEGKMIAFTGATVLFLIAIGFALGGILGAIVVLPLTAIVRDLFRYFFGHAADESLEALPGAT